MLKHFHLGRRISFPAIFIGSVAGAIVILQIPSVQAYTDSKGAFEIVVAVISVAAAFTHFLYSQHHQDTQIFISLFEKFNKRYDKLNEKLNAIINRPIGDALTDCQRGTLYDYFNLCSEEYMFFEAGYIDERVWRAWMSGMKQFTKDQEVLLLWKQEIASGSYYNFKLSLLDAV
jgi:hypothetical protein